VTLIVGLKCSNGIVLGGGGAATKGQAGQPTAIQPYVKKLSIHHNCIVVGVSGSVGISQRLNGIVSDAYTANAFSGNKNLGKGGPPVNAGKLHNVMTILRDLFWDNCLKKEVEVAVVARQISPAAVIVPQCAAVVAMPIERVPTMIQFDMSGSPEAATEDLPFIAIGSGQNIADPFLAFLRRIFWEDHRPNLAEGQFAVWWTLHHAIKSAPHGIADPKQIIVIETNNGQCVARELTQDDMREHEVAVGEAEDYLKKYKKMPNAAPQANDPTIPSPPQTVA